MSLRDALDKAPTDRHPNGRVYQLLMDRYLATMDEDDHETAVTLLNDPNRSIRWLADFFTANGYTIESGAIHKWRKRNGATHG